MRYQITLSKCAVVGVLSVFSLSASAQAAPSISPAVQPPAPRIVSAIDDDSLVTLKGNTHPSARASFDRGRVSPDLVMGDLVLVLRRAPEQQTEFDQFVASQYSLSSPNYHRWLTPEQVGELFGPAQSDIDAITNWLSNHGFEVIEVTKDRLSIRFSGTADHVESAFHTEIHNLAVTEKYAKGEKHIANMSDPQIPAALAPVVVGIKALHNFFPKPLHRLGNQVSFDRSTKSWRRMEQSQRSNSRESNPHSLAQATPIRPRPNFTTTDGYGNTVEDVAPYDFAKIYNVLPEWQASTPIDGTGQSIAIAGTSNIVLADVATFRSTFGLPAKAPSVVITNSDPGACPGFLDSCSGDLVENTLDVEWAGSVAKGASVILVTSSAPTATSDPLYLSESYIVQHKTAPVMNVSYGECELVLGTAGNIEYANLWETAASEGIAVFVASGDAGSPACDQGFDAVDGVPYAAQFGAAVSGLTSTPYDTSVGGTDFNWGSSASPYWTTVNATTGASALGYIPEVVWNDSCVNPLVLPVLQSDASYIGVTGVVDAESACNFVIESGQYIESNFGVNLFGLVDTIGGGGGVSNCTINDGSDPASCSGGYAKPSWQSGVKGIPVDKLRDVPDVSFFASNGFLGSSYLICVSGGGNACTYSTTSEPVAQEVGGTSVASPAMAGVMALINQKAGSAQGNPNSNLYALAAKQNYAGCSAETVKASTTSCIFNDVDSGNNAMPCANGSIDCSVIYAGDPAGVLSLSNGSPAFSATAGYDQATGLGSLNVANLVNNWPTSTTGPLVSLSPTSLTFSSTVVNTASATQSINLKNTGKSSLSLDGTGMGITISGTNASSYSQTNTCGTSVAASASCTIVVTFKPTVAGTLTAKISVADNAFGSPQSVVLSGTGAAAAPIASLGANSLSFSSTAVGSSNTAPAIKLSNIGTGPLTISSIGFTGTSASSFTQTNTCGTSLAAATSCNITITFKPVVAGSLTAALSVADNAKGTPQTLTLSGTATGGAATTVSLSPSSLTFTATPVGSSAAAQAITLKNTGTSTVTLSTGAITLTGTDATSFTQSTTCGTTLAANASCTTSVVFKPTAAGALTAKLSVADNAAGSPQSVTLTGTGLAISGRASFSPASLTFPSTAIGTSAASQAITLKNTGSGTITITSIALSGTSSSSFSIVSNTCGSSLAGAASCAITIGFKPTTAGTVTGSVLFNDTALGGSPQSVSLTGAGH